MAPIRKKRKLKHQNQVDELSFDPAARQEYLTGFRKRKQQRIQNAKDAAVKREREEKLRDRRQLREQRKVDLEKHVEEVNAVLRKQNPELWPEDENDENDEDCSNDDEVVHESDLIGTNAQDEEYVDEDRLTTVTVEPLELGRDTAVDDESTGKTGNGDDKTKAESKDSRKKSIGNGRVKVKKRKFRYETKAERTAGRQKQKAKNHAAKLRRTGKS